MTAANTDRQQVLRDEIIADAQRHAERTRGRAQHEAQELRARSRREVQKATQDRLDAARREAQRRRDLILAGVAVETGRRRRARVESILQAVYDEARRRLQAREGLDYREVLAALAAEAVARMDGTQFILELSDGDRAAFGDALVQEVIRRVGRPGLQVCCAGAGAKIAGGVIVRDADGRQLWDNSLLARLDRFWPVLRREIGVRTSLAGGGAQKEA